jgi:hypothetical protein
MAFGRKRTNPIDRALADVERQIADLQRQSQQLAAGKSNASSSPPSSGRSATHTFSTTATVTKFVKEMLRPPPKKPAPTAPANRRDLFDVTAEPLKELEAEPVAFAPRANTDLFSAPATTSTRIDCAPKPEEKLAHYLSAGSIKSYKPLRHVQRKTRNRFFMWLGLSLVAVWLIWVVIR